MITKQNLNWKNAEAFFTKHLQTEFVFSTNNKVSKKGKFLLYKRNHFFIQITLLSPRGVKENFEIPFPYKIELYEPEGLLYFDYRLSSLNLTKPILPPQKISSNYHNKILEIQSIKG
jgi:hypothetical protein